MLNNQVSKAVRLAIAFGAASTAAFSVSSFAAEEDGVEKVERIEVTGSRIKRTDLEGASPVNIITAEDMQIEGNFTVADALRGSSFNSFGSFSERSGSSAQSQATINLRGAGSSRTLVLLDGKRMPGSPTLGGQSANLNSIPMAAVERIEILTDGASSTYGSDAMAGVVNIIMKKNYEGLQFQGEAGHRDQDEGTTSSSFSVTAGYSTDKGNVTFAFDHQKREGISDGDRDYTKASATDLDGDGVIQAYEETKGWSIYGATVASPDFSEAQASPICDDLTAEYGEDTFRKFAADNDWGSEGSTYCMFAFANVSYNKASIDRNTVYLDANYELNDDIEWYGRAMFVQNSSFGRYAPPAAAWNNLAADNEANPYDEETTGYWRWAGIGNRDGNVDDYSQDYLMGLRGDLEWNNASWDVYYHTNKADNKSVGTYYLSYGGLAYNQANGIDLGSDEGVANMKATTLQSSSSTFNQYNAGIGFDLFELPGGTVAHYFGAEFLEQTYADIYDGQSEAGLIGGSAGNSALGDRDITAFFYEVAMPVVDSLEVNIAVRYDDYSDFGDNVAPKISARWQAADTVVVRASYSEAFRAPGLDQLNAATTFSAESAIDYSQGDTSSKQIDTYYKSNTELGPETSEYTNLGIAWDVIENFGVKADYFNLSIDDVIQTKTVQGLLSDEAAGRITAFAPGSDVSNETFYLIRSETGRLLEAGTGYFNGNGFEIEGLDLTLYGNIDTSVGEFRMNTVNSFVLSYDEERGGRVYNTAGWSGQPDFKSNTTLTWALDDHSVAWNMNYTSSTSENEAPNEDGILEQDGELDDWLIHNLTYSYNAGVYGTVRLSVSNLTDEDPVLTSTGAYDNADLYNNYGRDYRINYTINF
ncbi:TonB-dependent receptor domain-containing protein [Pseudoalteromonas sp. SWN166]|uniref:TonB-dependent receptor domain-containing protein n=1 Tax=Pseudoalteromonas sp. SWN166 TaxID=2792061 RepID=UPI0018CD4436|nr:TonB-dependent receptor [Pseudoalteromonas sp. SWN166]MBH0037616.1 TonB-dependent receptor [Pseudoalteromonas sp. SWN166]